MPALVATITGNANPLKVALQRSLKDIESAAARGAQLTRNAAGGHLRAGAMREFLVMTRELARGDFKRFGSSLTLFLQQLGLLRFLLHPATIGIAALAAAAFFTMQKFLGLREASKNLSEIMDWTRIKISAHADAMREAALRAADLHNWLKHLGESEETLGKKTMETLKAMREKARMERENARARGTKEKDLEKMDLAESEKELLLVIRAKLQAGRALEADKLQEPMLKKMLSSTSRTEALKSIQDSRGEMGRVADALQSKMRNTKISNYETVEGNYGVPMRVFAGKRAANANDVFDIEVAGKKYHMSLNQARKNLDALSKRESELEKAEHDLKAVVERKKKLGERDAASLQQLTQEEQAIKEHISNLKHQMTLPAQGMLSVHLSAAQKAGAFVQIASGHNRLTQTAEKIEHHVATLVRQGQTSTTPQTRPFNNGQF